MKLGTHNLHDDTGRPTPFADVLLFTEAIPRKVREVLKDEYRIYACHQQRDLIIAIDRNLDFKLKRKHYKLVHIGIPLVTPHRGIFWLTGTLEGVEVTLLVEHRINAAFPPFVRGESKLRPRWWKKHTEMTLKVVAAAKLKGHDILAGGDLNTPHGVSGYQGHLNEVGEHFDRLGVHGMKVEYMEVLSRAGSDHQRLRAEVRNLKA